MKIASEYRNHAQESRVLAQQMPSGQERKQLLRMARAWERLAETREELIRNTLNWTQEVGRGQRAIGCEGGRGHGRETEDRETIGG
jgi:hypothetical protein